MTPDRFNGSRQPADPRDMVLFDDASNGYGKRAVYVETLDQPRRTEGGAGLLDIWQLLRGHLGLIAAIGVLGALGGALLTIFQTPQFRARTTVEVQPQSATNMGFTAVQPAEVETTESYVKTQQKILMSQTLNDRVLAKLAQTNRLSSYSPPDRMARLRQVFHLPAAKSKPNHEPGKVPAFDFKVTYDTTHIMELSCESADPRFAADYVNTVADEFRQMQMEARLDAYKRTSEVLNDQLAEIERKLKNGEERLKDYALSSGLMITDGKDVIPEEKLKEIQHELTMATSARINAQASYDSLRGAPQDSVPQVLDNERLSGYKTELEKLSQKLAAYQTIYTEEAPETKNVKAEIDVVEKALKSEQNNIITRITNDYKAARLREQYLLETYKTQSSVVSDHSSRYALYDILKREVDTDRELYTTLLQKVRESGVASSFFSSDNVRVIDSATIPSSPFRPSMSINVAAGLLGALFLGIGLVVIGDQVNRSLKTPGETSMHLRVPELGVIPAYDGGLISQAAVPKILGGTTELNGKKPGEQVELAMRNDAQSLVAESFRNVLTSILLSDSAEQRPRVIVVTAAGRQAGKSSSVSNLALALAEIGQKVLVIDADMRRPRQHSIFETSNSWGLSDILRERTSLKDCPLEAIARPLENNGLYLLPAGPPCANVSSLLYSNRISELLQRLRREFDTILIDTPPVLMVSDARVVGRLADASILVIRAGETTRDMAFQAKQRLVDDGIVVLGTILNQFRMKSKAARYSNYNYGMANES